MTKPRWPNKVPSGASPQNVSDILGSVASETFTLLTNGLTVADNMAAQIVKVVCTHNTESLIDLGGAGKLRPAWFQPLYTQKSLTDPTAALPVLGTPAPLNLSRPDGRIGVTLQFAPPANKLRVYKAANQTAIPSGTGTTIAFDTTDYIVGVFSYASGVFTVPESGLLRVGYCIIGTANGVAAGDSWGTFARNITTANRGPQQRFAVPTQSSPRAAANGNLTVTKGDTVDIQLVQSNAAAATKDVSGGTSGTNASYAEFSYASPPTNYAACVVGILWGG